MGSDWINERVADGLRYASIVRMSVLEAVSLPRDIAKMIDEYVTISPEMWPIMYQVGTLNASVADDRGTWYIGFDCLLTYSLQIATDTQRTSLYYDKAGILLVLLGEKDDDTCIPHSIIRNCTDVFKLDGDEYWQAHREAMIWATALTRRLLDGLWDDLVRKMALKVDRSEVSILD
jgi:hypothetical protein